jgi:hypothetical protein
VVSVALEVLIYLVFVNPVQLVTSHQSLDRPNAFLVTGVILLAQEVLLCSFPHFFYFSVLVDTFLTCLPASGASICSACPKGTTSLNAATACLNCSAGQYSNVEGSSSCVGCDLGRFFLFLSFFFFFF